MSQTVPLRTDPRRFAPSAASVSGLSIGEYLIRRLQDYGIGHVFGIPGDYVLGFYSLLEKSPIRRGRLLRARIAPASPPTPTPASTAWAPSA